ncbi:hypothetical protein ACTFIW_000814 [Dictyostelium discoideum]
MSLSDSIADFLTLLRNASTAGHRHTDVMWSKLIQSMAEILKSTGFIEQYLVREVDDKNEMRVFLKLGAYHIPSVFNGMGNSIISTSKGILSSHEARKKHVGGAANESVDMTGLYPALIQNMVTGVSQGFEKMLEMISVGYRAVVQVIAINGIDRQAFGQFSEIHALRPPEPYQGKGIRYRGEFVRRKAEKASKSAKNRNKKSVERDIVDFLKNTCLSRIKRAKLKVKRAVRVRFKLIGTAERPRMSVVKSNKHISVQLIDDIIGVTIASASTLSKDLKTTESHKK